MSQFTDFYLKADTEQVALNAANVDGYDLVVQDEDGTLRWNTSPSGGRSAFTTTRGPITGYEKGEEGEEGEQIPVHAEGFYGLLRVRSESADTIHALLHQRGVLTLDPVDCPTRFS